MSPRRVVATAKSTVIVDSFEIPRVGPGQVLLETLASAISPGTELAFIHNKPNTPGMYPFYPGYSACCRVIEKHTSVDALAIGQRVTCKMPHASHYVVAADSCHLVPENVPDTEAAVFRLVSIALQGIRKAQIQLGWDVAVLGLGPIGNLAGQLARVAGSTHVEGIDLIGWRREIALQCGFDAVAESVDQAALKTGYHVVMESTGAPDVVPSAFQLARIMGAVVLLASTRGITDGVNFYRDVHKKGLTVVGAHDSIRPVKDDHLFYCSHQTDVETALKLMAAGRLQITPLVSDVVPADDAAQAYELLNNREEHFLVVLRWAE